jgi:hypothetical protein
LDSLDNVRNEDDKYMAIGENKRGKSREIADTDTREGYRSMKYAISYENFHCGSDNVG